MDVSILKKLGMNDKDIIIYFELVKNNAVSVRELSDLTGINRGTVHDILKKMIEMGLASYYHQETKQKFTAEDPSCFERILREKENELKNAKSKLSDLIPELHSLQKKGDKPVTKFYEGCLGIKSILKDVIESFESAEVKEYYVYSAKKASEDWKKAYPEFTKDRIKRKIKVFAISLAEGGKTSGLDERKWLGSNDESATFIVIYNDKCAYLSRDAMGKPFGVIIENKMIYETQKLVFMSLWQLLK